LIYLGKHFSDILFKTDGSWEIIEEKSIEDNDDF
jgi:hypothetical protein